MRIFPPKFMISKTPSSNTKNNYFHEIYGNFHSASETTTCFNILHDLSENERKIRLEISQFSFLLRFWRSKCDLENIEQKKMNFWKTFRKISWKQNFHNFHKLTLPWIINYNLEWKYGASFLKAASRCDVSVSFGWKTLRFFSICFSLFQKKLLNYRTLEK